MHPDGQDSNDINMFFLALFLNKITVQLIDEASKASKITAGQSRVGRLPKWLGLTFSMESAEGKAMISESALGGTSRRLILHARHMRN